MNAITMCKHMLLHQVPLVDQAIKAVGILNHPRPVLPAYLGVQTRNTLGSYLHVVARKAADSQNGFIQLAFAGDSPIYLDQDTRFPVGCRRLGGLIASCSLWRWLPAPINVTCLRSLPSTNRHHHWRGRLRRPLLRC